MADRFEGVLRSQSGARWRRFSRPARVVSTHEASEVRRALLDVEEATRGGLYAAGFVSYEAAAAFGLPARTGRLALPLVCFGLYESDSVEELSRFPAAGIATTGDWQPSIDHAAYLRAIAAIKQRIEAGDTYQINFTFRLTALFSGEPSALMRNLYAAQAGRWSAYLDTGRFVICSASPELFLARERNRLECLPMKGTAARGWWPAQDAARGKELQASEKNRAENVMIVDMVRNDLGRVAAAGSVQAASLFDVERYPLQWQMTSRVVADAPGVPLDRLFEAMFPSGSVTGAPKHSAMGIIRELESTPRGIYTGAIGCLSPDGRAHFNVAIRTAVVDRERGTVEFGVGSGVVWDSIDRDEYEECLLKARMVTGSSAVASSVDLNRPTPSYITGEHPDFALFETVRWDPAGGFRLLERHLARLHASADCFGFETDLTDLRVLLEAAVADLTGPTKVRLRLDYDGSVLCEAVDLDTLPDRPLHAALGAEPVDLSDLFLFHKTTRRSVYERARGSRPSAEAVILWNTSGEITEATDFNVVVEVDGRKVTPPVQCGLLPGTLRAELLESGEIVERRISVSELQHIGRGWLINSVRGQVPFVLSEIINKQ